MIIMNLLAENIIPGNHGKVFSTDAKKDKDILKMITAIKKIPGIKDVIVNKDVFPIEFTILTTSLIHIETVENEVKRFGFHAIPKGIFEL